MRVERQKDQHFIRDFVCLAVRSEGPSRDLCQLKLMTSLAV